jgi:hypothetical protein
MLNYLLTDVLLNASSDDCDDAKLAAVVNDILSVYALNPVTPFELSAEATRQ